MYFANPNQAPVAQTSNKLPTKAGYLSRTPTLAGLGDDATLAPPVPGSSPVTFGDALSQIFENPSTLAVIVGAVVVLGIVYYLSTMDD